MGTHEIQVDVGMPLTAAPAGGHNRWHPDIPPALRCAPGDEILMTTRDALDGVLGPDATLADLAKVDLGVVHPLTGPVYVEGAEPGDILVVDILEVAPAAYGFTIQLPGFGFLRDAFPDPFLAMWQLADGYATSAEIPGVRIPGAPFMGILGVAPSHGLMVEVKTREADLAGRGGMALLPDLPARCRRPGRWRGRGCARSRRGRTAATSTSSSWSPARGSTCRCGRRVRCSPPATRTSPRATARRAAPRSR